MRQISFALVLALVSACKEEDSPSPPDLAMPSSDMRMLLSQCGHPGDTGNSLGVGKFCTSISDCQGPGMKTNICSSLGNGGTPTSDDTYFCTIYPCKMDAGTGQCGESATCVCGSGGGGSGCACTPNSCLGSPPDGGHPDGH